MPAFVFQKSFVSHQLTFQQITTVKTRPGLFFTFRPNLGFTKTKTVSEPHSRYGTLHSMYWSDRAKNAALFYLQGLSVPSCPIILMPLYCQIKTIPVCRREFKRWGKNCLITCCCQLWQWNRSHVLYRGLEGECYNTNRWWVLGWGGAQLQGLI